MTKPDSTFIAIVLDASGSMQSVRDATIEGVNGFLGSQREVPGDVRVSLMLFNTVTHMLYDGLPLQAAPDLTHETYVPDGSTALLDAIGHTIDNVGAQLAALPDDQRPGKIVVAIMTDGFENASHRYSRDRIHSMITHQRTKYAWQFVFLAANQDAITTGETLGVPMAAAMSYAPSARGMHVMTRSLGETVNSYRSNADPNIGLCFDGAARASNAAEIDAVNKVDPIAIAAKLKASKRSPKTK